MPSTPRNIAVRIIFHTVDLYFGEDQDNVRENLNRGLDMFDRVKADPIFASRIKILRLHWAYEEGDMLDLMTRMVQFFYFRRICNRVLFQASSALHYLPSEPCKNSNGLGILSYVQIWYKPSSPPIHIYAPSAS